MVFININGVDMPNPLYKGGYTLELSDLDSEKTTRSETGMMNRDRVRAGVYKINCKWLVTTADLDKICNAISSDKFTVNFYDGGGNKSAEMYVGNRSIALILHKENVDWWNLSCSFIQY